MWQCCAGCRRQRETVSVGTILIVSTHASGLLPVVWVLPHTTHECEEWVWLVLVVGGARLGKNACPRGGRAVIGPICVALWFG